MNQPQPQRLIPTGPTDKLDERAQARVQAVWAARRAIPTSHLNPHNIELLAKFILGDVGGTG